MNEKAEKATGRQAERLHINNKIQSRSNQSKVRISKHICVCVCLYGYNNEGTLASTGIGALEIPQYQLSQSKLIPEAGLEHQDLISR